MARSVLYLLFSLLAYVCALDSGFLSWGIIQPDSTHQRWRRTENPKNKPFYQWYYYWVRDYETGQHFAFGYSTSYAVDEAKSNQGAYMYLATVGVGDQNIARSEKFDLDLLQITNNFTLDLAAEGEDSPSFMLHPINDDKIELYGKMNHYKNTWHTLNCEETTYFEWNLTLHRIHGYFGQPDFQKIDYYLGVIQWNTYAHNSEVEGYIKINDKTYTFTRGPRYRLYGDENWGQTFPHPPKGEDPKKYAWGWYQVTKPSEKVEEEVAIIIGTGNTEVGFPLYSCLGQFADIRIGKDFHLELVWEEFWQYTVIDSSFKITNDGKIKTFKVDRQNWITYTDEMGNADIPLNQIVTMETTNYKCILNFTSTQKEYNRLTFPYQYYTFSDFEALGTKVSVYLEKTTTGEVLLDFNSNFGGLEFGYDVEADKIFKEMGKFLNYS